MFNSKSRKGIKWELELSEGIDLSIYVFGCFERETTKALKKNISSDSYILDIGANIGGNTHFLDRLRCWVKREKYWR